MGLVANPVNLTKVSRFALPTRNCDRVEQVSHSYQTEGGESTTSAGCFMTVADGEFVSIIRAKRLWKKKGHFAHYGGSVNRASRGQITLDGHPGFRSRNHQIGLLFQATNLIPSQTGAPIISPPRTSGVQGWIVTNGRSISWTGWASRASEMSTRRSYQGEWHNAVL